MIHIGRIELSYKQAHTSSYQPCERPAFSNQRRVTDLDEGSLIEYLPCHYFGNFFLAQKASLLIDGRLYCRNKHRRVGCLMDLVEEVSANSAKDLSQLCCPGGECLSKNVSHNTKFLATRYLVLSGVSAFWGFPNPSTAKSP